MLFHVVISTNYEHYRNAWDEKYVSLGAAIERIKCLVEGAATIFFFSDNNISDCFDEYGLDPAEVQLDCTVCLSLYLSDEDDLSDCVDWEISRLIATWYGAYCTDILKETEYYQPLSLDSVENDATSDERKAIETITI